MYIDYDKIKCLFPFTFWGILSASFAVLNPSTPLELKQIAFTILFANSVVGARLVQQDSESIANSCGTSATLVHILDLPTHFLIPFLLFLYADSTRSRVVPARIISIWMYATLVAGAYMTLSLAGITTDYGLGFMTLMRKYSLLWIIAAFLGSCQTTLYLA